MKAPRCLRCSNKRATFPADFAARGFAAPRYCTAKCAAEHAVEQSMDRRWCVTHGEWFDLNEGFCDRCNMASQLADDAQEKRQKEDTDNG